MEPPLIASLHSLSTQEPLQLHVPGRPKARGNIQVVSSCLCFTRLAPTTNVDPLVYSLANNGWIWAADPLKKFAELPSKCYFRCEVIVWGDCVVKLHIALLDAVCVVNPDLYVCAELFAGNEETDTGGRTRSMDAASLMSIEELASLTGKGPVRVPEYFPPGSIMLFETHPHEYDVSFLHVNEERDASGGEFGVYDVPGLGKMSGSSSSDSEDELDLELPSAAPPQHPSQSPGFVCDAPNSCQSSPDNDPMDINDAMDIDDTSDSDSDSASDSGTAGNPGHFNFLAPAEDEEFEIDGWSGFDEVLDADDPVGSREEMLTQLEEIVAPGRDAELWAVPLNIEPVWIHCCVNSCMAYTGDDAELHTCRFCKEPRFTLILHKPRRFFCYLPIIPRLQGYFQNRVLVKQLLYRHKYEHKPETIADVFDSIHYRTLRKQNVVVDGKTLPYKYFSGRYDIALGICLDSYLLFKHNHGGPSATPILLKNFNRGFAQSHPEPPGGSQGMRHWWLSY
ncbi:hypothetical protein DFH08DRAFT_1020774 [Mycena albidolilacea]|uniref:Glycogen debranching enzyme glucanotransferase domain-containing protein n=1 Tax=Mycena albidolilacea TaxID=1033008 RepID=A0AAD7EJU4_9AGAR|nr:hypothetical protein DFH08DRAFT_1020774 [Mycena albidolilacea]